MQIKIVNRSVEHIINVTEAMAIDILLLLTNQTAKTLAVAENKALENNIIENAYGKRAVHEKKKGRPSKVPKEEILSALDRGAKVSEVAKKFGVTAQQVYSIRSLAKKSGVEKEDVGEEDNNFEVTPEVKARIKQYLSEGMGSAEIAETYGISRTLANKAIMQAKGLSL